MYRRLSLFLTCSLFLMSAFRAFPQNHYVDSLKKRIDTARSDVGKIMDLIELAGATLDREKSAEYGNQALELAQLTRDKRLITKVYLYNGNRFMGNSALTDNLIKGSWNYQQAEALARENGLEDLEVLAYAGLANVWHDKGNDVKALSFATQALAVATTITDDSAKVAAYVSLGRV